MIFALLLVAELGGLFLLSRVLQRGLSGMLLRLTGSQRVATWVMAVLFLPGTFLHELSHLVVARLLLVRAGHLTVVPRMEADRVVMGRVLIPATDRIRRLIIGVAPGLVGVVVILGSLWVLQRYELWQSWPWVLAEVYVVFEVGNTLFSSRADLEGMVGLVMLVGLVVGLLYWGGFRPSMTWVGPWLDQYGGVLRQAVWLFGVPLVIDAGGVVLMWGVRKVVRI